MGNNTGKNNSGRCNTGDYNTGNHNTGNFNSGRCNTDDYNTGNRNTGNFNSGRCNTGDYNTGDCNSGYFNPGSYNTGDSNTGLFNSGKYNSGWFNTNEPTARFFNKETNIKLSEFYDGDSCPDIVFDIFELTEWIYSSDMTEKEKKENPNYGTTGGYLKTYTYKEAWANFWINTTEKNKQKFLNLPNFDADIFFEITGIDVRNKNLSGKEVQVIIDGKEYTAIIK